MKGMVTRMSEGRYNIPKKYKVDKGMPIDALTKRIDNEKCRMIFENEIASIRWCYQLVDNDDIHDVNMLIRQNGISVFEVVMNHKISTELMTEMLTSLIPKRCVITYIYEDELAMATFIPGENGYASRLCATDYYRFDRSKTIEILNYEYDSNKTMEQIHRRILATVRQQKRVIMVEKAFESLQKNTPPKQPEVEFSFDEESIARIREDADFVQEQLHVVMVS